MTTTSMLIHRCTSVHRRCVFIDSIEPEGDMIVVRYTTTGYEPELDPPDSNKHVHFYFDTVPVDQAGIYAATTNWIAYDTDDNGEKIYRFAAATIPDGATKLCASVANINHGLDDLVQDCEALP